MVLGLIINNLFTVPKKQPTVHLTYPYAVSSHGSFQRIAVNNLQNVPPHCLAVLKNFGDRGPNKTATHSIMFLQTMESQEPKSRKAVAGNPLPSPHPPSPSANYYTYHIVPRHLIYTSLKKRLQMKIYPFLQQRINCVTTTSIRSINTSSLPPNLEVL